MPTEPKHTDAELSAQDSIIYARCVPMAYASSGNGLDWLPGCRFLDDETAKANAARLVQGWNHLNELDRLKTTPDKVLNLLNRLEETGVSDAVAEIKKLRDEVRDLDKTIAEMSEQMDGG